MRLLKSLKTKMVILIVDVLSAKVQPERNFHQNVIVADCSRQSQESSSPPPNPPDCFEADTWAWTLGMVYWNLPIGASR
jgi:hypothetical protein